MSSQGLMFFSLMIIAFVPKTSTTNSAVFQRGKSNAVAFCCPLNEGVMWLKVINKIGYAKDMKTWNW